jgi:tetratricopeptide (TPR) repeat protein
MKTNLFVVTVGLTCICASSLAMAQGNQDSDTNKAATRFQQAVELYREGSFEGALAEFRKAYQLSPSYRVLYNIAQTQYALHDFVGAYKSLTQYMNEGRGEIAADRRVQVDDMSAKLAERIAHLHITTNVEGAEIRVDDIIIGTSPLSELVPVNVGSRKISVHSSGAPVANQVITVAGKERVKVDLPIGEPATTKSSKVTRETVSSPNPTSDLSIAIKPVSKKPPSKVGLIVSLSATAALFVSTSVLGYLALSAQSDFNDQINTFPNTNTNIENARSKSKHYALLADGFGAATILSGGVALYFLLADGAVSSKSVAVSPTLGGMILHGNF